MRKSFTRLLSLVMLFALFSSVVMAGDATALWPSGATAFTKTTDKILIIYPGTVQAGTGSVRVSAGGVLQAVIPATDSRISYAKGDTVQIDLSATLKEMTSYTVDVDASTFKTVATTPVNKSSESFTFTTGDYKSPVLKSVTPVKGSSLTATPVSLVVTFEDASSNSAVLSGNIAIYKADGNLWQLINTSTGTITSSYNGGTSLYTYTLTVPVSRSFEDNITYAVTISAGAVKDAGNTSDGSNNSFAGLTDRSVWTFSTKDMSAPVISSGYPKKGTVGNVSASVLVKTAEAGKAYGYIQPSASAAPSVATVTGAANSVTLVAGSEASISFTGLSEATSYNMYVVTENVDGVQSGVSSAVAVTTSETVAPTLAAVNYYKGTTLKATGSVVSNAVTTATGTATATSTLAVDKTIDNIVLDFSENVKIGAGNLLIIKASDNTTALTVASTSLSIDATDNSLVKVPVSGLANNTSYYVTIPNTLIQDTYTNKYVGISATNAWPFTTTDTEAPTFTYTPAEAASNVAKNANIVLTFNELIYAKGIYSFATAFELKVNNVVSAYTVTSTNNDSKFTTITIDPASDFASSAVVSVRILPDALGDIGFNSVDTQGQGINFVVKDFVGPTATWTTVPSKPEDSAVITFNEGIYLAGGGEITNSNISSILTVKATDANGANIAYSATIDDAKKKITITPTTPWTSESQYYIAFTSALQDVATNLYDDSTPANRVSTFTIKDVTSATVDLSNVDGLTISTSLVPKLIFKEGTAVEARQWLYWGGSWHAYALADMYKVIVLKEGSASGPDVPFSVTNTAGDNATFEIVATLTGNKTYYLGVGASTTGGSNTNVDENSNTKNVAKFVTFNTKFEGVPSVVSLSPVDEAKQVAKGSNFVITFDTAVQLKGTYASGDVTISGTSSIAVASSEISISTDGKTVTIDPSSELSNDGTYNITVAAGTFLNKNNTANGNAAISATDWNFTTTDTQLNVSLIAPDFTTSAAIDAKLVLTFGEKVVKGLGTILIKKSASDALVESIDVVSSNVVVSDDQLTVTITPSALFSYNTAYYIETSAGLFKDLVGNPLGAIYGKADAGTTANWTFTTSDPALAIVKTTPSAGSDKVGVTSSIIVEFNREIAAVSSSNSVGYWEGTSTTAQMYTLGSSNITISGKVLTITHPDKAFPANTEIALNIPAGVIKAANNSLIVNSVVDKTTNAVKFNTGDVNAPVPTFTPAAFNSLSPVYTATNTSITVTFDEEIYNPGGTLVANATDIAALFTITKPGPVTVNFLGSISGKTVTLVPTAALSEYTDYTVTVLAGLKDSKGTATASNITNTFRTEDKTAPVITGINSTTPLVGGVKQFTVPAVTVADAAGNNNKFYYLVRVKSDAAAPSAAEIKAANTKTIAQAAAGFTVSDLNPSTTYQFYYIADDTFGNTSSVAVAEVSTTDTVAPLLVSTLPVAGATNVDVAATTGDVVVKLTFNENVVAGTSGVITVRDYATNAVVKAYTQTALSTVSGDTKSLNLTLGALLSATSSPAKFYVEISSGTVVDGATTPNNFGGVFGNSTIYFTTEDNSAPTVVAASSTSGTVALDTNIKVVFSEDVKAGTTGNLVLYKTSVATANAVQVFTPTEATFSGNTVTVKPTAALTNGLTYIVEVTSGFATDLSSNANSNAASQAVTFTATTNVKPSIVDVRDNVNAVIPTATKVAKGLLASIKVTFTEDIYITTLGYLKPLALLTQSELLAKVSMKDANGNSIAISQITKVGTNAITVVTSSSSYSDLSAYTLTIKGFEDNAGLVMDDAVYTFNTSDGTPPVIVFSPLYKATSVTAGSSLSMTFSEDFYAQVLSADNKIFALVDNSNVANFVFLKEATIGGTDVEFTATISGKVITIVPKAALKSGVKYYYGLKRNVFDINSQGISVGGVTTYSATERVPVTTDEDLSCVYFTTADVTAPTIVSFSPTTGATSQSKSVALSVIFNENITVSTGSVVIRREDGTIFQTVSGSDLSIDSSNAKMLKIAHNDFESNQAYFVELTASAVKDGAGNGNAAYSDPKPATGWVFTTADTFSLTATVTPNGDNQSSSVNLQLAFNKVPTGVANKYVVIYKADGTAVQQTLASGLTPVGKVVSIPTTLEANTSYYARVEPGAFNDGVGNTYAGIMDNSWVFSTVNNIAPQLVTLSPADNATSVDASTKAFTMTFDRNVAVGTGVISVRYSVDGKVFEDIDVTKAVVDAKTLTFNVTKDLDAKTAFYVYVPVGAITNTEVTKDPFAGILNVYTWNFTTATDATAPKLVTWTPNATTTTDNDPTYVLTFDENVVLGAGNLKIYKKSDNALALTIPVTATMVNGKVVTVKNTYDATLKNGLDKNTDYYVLVDAGLVKDAAGNTSAAVTDVAAWTFKTGADFATVIEDPINISLAFKVYPNPFVDDVTVETSFDLTKVVVTNIAGQVVKQVVNPTGTIQLNELRSGVYFMSLYEGNKVAATVKIVKR